MKSSTNRFKLPYFTPLMLWLSQVLNVLLVSSQLLWWMNVVIGLCFLFQALLLSQKFNHYYPKKRAIVRWVISLIAISGCIAIASASKSIGLLLSMVHLLCFAYVLKGFELKNRKDFYQSMLLALFILATALIFQQSLAFTLLVVLMLVLNFSVLLYYFSASNDHGFVLKKTTIIILQSMPLAVVLFLVFPRLAPLWQVPLSKSATTGLSDQVSPGDIANLARSNDLAFRVTFEDETPSYGQLYWRALVLEDYDGRKWQRSKRNKNQAKAIIKGKKYFSQQATGVSINYQVIAQPSYQRWLYALDLATKSAKNTSLNMSLNTASFVELPDFTLQNKKIVSQMLNYQVTSFLQAPLALQISQQQRTINLQFPQGSNPKLEQEGLKLKKQFGDAGAIAQAVLNRFSEQNYYYTLKPPLLENNSLDQFFYNTKKGFCVHYASAFTFLMRAAGVPARVVTGYMGGEYNPAGGYFSIYQYEAHAWSEIWIAGKGWQRFDPTAAVDPKRVESGFSSQLLAEQSSFSNQFFNLQTFKNNQWLNALRLKLAALDYQWARAVVNFSNQRQLELLSTWFGSIKAWKTTAVILVAFLIVFASLWLIQQGKSRRIKINPWLVLYHRALNIFSNKGLNKAEHVPVNDFLQLAIQKYPVVSMVFKRFTDNFICLHYQKLSEEEQQRLLLAMKKQLKQIKLLMANY